MESIGPFKVGVSNVGPYATTATNMGPFVVRVASIGPFELENDGTNGDNLGPYEIRY